MMNRMEFMKRAIQKQKEEAKLEAERLIQALQEEKNFDDEFEEKSDNDNGNNEDDDEEEDNEETKAIREALAAGSIRRNKKETKSLEVKDNISIKQVGECICFV